MLWLDGSCCNGSSPGYHENFTEEFRESIREMDNQICQLCGKTEEENGMKLDVHHIHYDEETNDCSNATDFISRCRGCHGKTQWNRDYWEYHLAELLDSELQIVNGILSCDS